MTGFIGWSIVRTPVPIRVNDLDTLVAAVDDEKQITLTITDGEMTIAWPFQVQRIDSLHRCSRLHLPGGCKLDVRPIVLLRLLTSRGILGMDCFARYHARADRGTFISREVYECLRWHRSESLVGPAGRGVEPLVRTFNEQLLNEQSSHV